MINGQKTWTSNGMDATHCMLLTRTDPDAPAHRGISALLVPLDVPGIQRRPIRMISGEAEFAELFFTDVRVPRSALLGPLHGGWGVTVRTLKHERAGVIGQAAGLERRARRAIGDAGGARLAATVREQLARRYVEARVVGLLGADTLARAERGMDIGSAQALIKLAWGMADRQLGETAFDAFGPAAAAGVRNDLTRNLLYARSSTIAAGTTEILKNLVADRVLELPR